MTRLVVAHSHSAVLPRDLIAGLGWCSAVLFLVRGAEGSADRPISPLLADLGDVVELGPADVVPWDAVRGFRPDGVVTFSEDLLECAAEISAALRLPHTSPATIATVRDKRLQRARLRSAGVDFTRCGSVTSPHELPEVVDHIGLPIVLKPADGAGSTSVTLSRTLDEARAQATAFFERWPRRVLALEEYLQGRTDLPFGDYVSVESLVDDGEVRHLGVTGKLPMLPPFRETAQFHPSGLGADLETGIRDLATDAIHALGITQGAVHTEVKLTPGGPRLIEVNARLGGYVNELYTRVLGCDIIEAVTRTACGQAVGIPAPDARVHFQYTHQPPPGATRLVGIDGTRDVARHPLTTRYERLVPPGAALADDHSTQDLDLLCGTVDSLTDLLSVMNDVRSALRFTFESGAGPLILAGTDLGNDVRREEGVAP